jgi:hypothetical protein
MIDNQIEKTIILITNIHWRQQRKNAITRIIAFNEQYKDRKKIFIE